MKKLDINTLRKKVTLYIAMAMFLLGAMIIIMSTTIQKYRVNMQEQSYAKQIDLGVEHVVKHYIRDYSYRTKRMLTSPSVSQMILSKDRDSLYKFFKPKWDLMSKEEENLKVMHFHLADGSSFLRMHTPEKFGDSLVEIRPMIKEIHSSHKPIDGYETGKYGTNYRVIEPIFDENGEYIGAFEIGMNPKFILRAIKEINGFCGMMFIKESSLFLYSTPSDIVIDGYRLQSELKAPLDKISQKLTTLLKLEDGMKISTDDKVYRSHLFTLKSFFKADSDSICSWSF